MRVADQSIERQPHRTGRWRRYDHSVSQRDDFPQRTRAVLAQRAAYRCSNPRCRNLTVRPHSDVTRAVITGVAAHIRAAAPGGPRFDPEQSTDERRSAANGIWLCHVCSDLVDGDPSSYSVEQLLRWRGDHESWLAQENLIPPYPTIDIATVAGLRFPSSGVARITGDDAERYRDHVLRVETSSLDEVHQLRLRVQFPESVVGVSDVEAPPGVEVRIGPERPQFNVNVGQGASIERGAVGRPTNIFILEIERLIPRRPVGMNLRTTQGVAEVNPASRFLQVKGDFYWLAGSYLYRDGLQLFERTFISRIIGLGNRCYRIGPPEDDDGSHRLIESTFIG